MQLKTKKIVLFMFLSYTISQKNIILFAIISGG